MWSPGDTLVIDWGAEGPLHVFCAVLAWSRWRFVRFAADERAETTLAMLVECFEELGGVPKVVADRMGCLKGGVVANIVVPTPDYVRFATHYQFRPDFCEGGDPESKGIVENLVGYAKSDLVVPTEPNAADLATANGNARGWCDEVAGGTLEVLAGCSVVPVVEADVGAVATLTGLVGPVPSWARGMARRGPHTPQTGASQQAQARPAPRAACSQATSTTAPGPGPRRASGPGVSSLRGPTFGRTPGGVVTKPGKPW